MNYLFGASGHGSVILDILGKNNVQVDAFLDGAVKPNFFEGIPCYVFPGAAILETDAVLVSIGNNLNRKKVASMLGCKFLTAVHPSVILDPSVVVGEGTAIMAGAVLNAHAQVGKHVIINTSSVIDHDCIIGDFVHISPAATLCGNVKVGAGTHIGAGAVVIPNISIGRDSVIGAGAVVIKDVPDYVMVVGNPGRIIKHLKI